MAAPGSAATQRMRSAESFASAWRMRSTASRGVRKSVYPLPRARYFTCESVWPRLASNAIGRSAKESEGFGEAAQVEIVASKTIKVRRVVLGAIPNPAGEQEFWDLLPMRTAAVAHGWRLLKRIKT